MSLASRQSYRPEIIFCHLTKSVSETDFASTMGLKLLLTAYLAVLAVAAPVARPNSMVPQQLLLPR